MSDAPVVELMGPATGGIRTHVADLSARLRTQGLAVEVAGPRGALGALGEVDRVVPVPSSADPLRTLAAAAALRRGPSRLVHAHGLKAGWVALAARRRPVVVTLHNLVLSDTGRTEAVLRRLEARLVRRVDHVIAPNAAIAAHARALAPDTPTTVIIPSAPLPEPRRAPGEVRRAHGIAADAPLVVCVARLHPQKDLSTFLAAMAALSGRVEGVRALLVGDGPLRDVLGRQVRAAGLEGVVELVGPSDHAVDEMAAADVVAISSRWEAIPLVAVEALLLGRPLVSTPVGIVSELVVDGHNGRVVPMGDAAAMAEAMAEALAVRGDAATVAAARRAAAELVGPDRLAAQVAAVYDEVLATPGTRR